MAIAHELRMDDDEVAAWPIGKLIRWNEYFKRKAKYEKEAMDKAQKEAERKSKRRR